ncbi:MAG: FecR domain-containing protein [Phycisphaerae bacterium]|nr:FecR domain-containing protein [Phycisphaerae bacterium]
MKNLLRICLSGIALLVLVSVSFAQKDKTAVGKVVPVPQEQSKPKPMVVTVKEVSGTAHHLMTGKDKKWAPLKVGDKLDEMTVIRTGFRTKVVLTFADNSEVTIERATKMGIKQFRTEGKVTKTTLGLKYGSLRATVKKASGPNDFRIATPVATAAARGSRLRIISSGDFGSEMKCSSGKWNVRKGAKHRNLVKGESTNNNLLASIKMAKKSASPMIGDVFGGLTPKELKYIRTYGGRQSGFTKIIARPKPMPIVCVRGLNITIGD